MAAPLVWINGYPGTGKLTVANIVVEKLAPVPVILIDNHQLIDPVEAKYHRGHAEYNLQRRLQRGIAFSTHVEDPQTLSRVVIFTDFQSTDKLGSSVAREYEAVAKASGRPFVPIYLTCELEENLRRVNTPERVNSGTTKLVDLGILRQIHEQSQLFMFDIGRSIDVTSLEPIQTAEMIIAEIMSRYPHGAQ